jgi:putative zinc finger/helix-turn-helix YgiT family protein
MFCLDCGCEMVETRDAIVEKYKDESFAVEGVEHFVCPQCGEYSLTAAASRKLTKGLVSQYARLHGLLTPEEIVAIRNNLNLTQVEFQKMLGVSGVSVSRWETGRAQQSKPLDNLMRGIAGYPCFAKDLMERSEVGVHRYVSKSTACSSFAHSEPVLPDISFEGGN